MIGKLLVANRGEIARRVIRTARSLGVRTVAVHSDVDEGAVHVAEADESVRIPGSAAIDTYANMDRVMEAVAASGADAVHPGYGFLSENSAFARRVADAEVVWVGPKPETMDAVADKVAARSVAIASGVPVAEGTDGPVDPTNAIGLADRIGYPLIVKAAAGGGGIGMAVVAGPSELSDAIATASHRSGQSFASDDVFLERYLKNARHVEVQILGLPDGRVIPLAERDCSIQRRYQKIIEESPAPGLSSALRARLSEAAVAIGEAVGYENAGTIEFLVSGDEFVFLEVNARLQVEHPVTELVTGLDLVADQIRIASGEPTAAEEGPISPHGHAIELRINAEDPIRFLPSPGRIDLWEEPTADHIRVDAGYQSGDTVSPHYDALLGKCCVWAPDRAAAVERARAAAKGFRIEGIKTNLPFLIEVLEDPRMRDGIHDTGLVASLRP